MDGAVKVNGVVKWRHVAAVVAAVAGLLGIHSQIVGPQIASAVNARLRPELVEIEKAREHRIQLHARGVHPGAVKREEFVMLTRQLDRIENRLDKLVEASR